MRALLARPKHIASFLDILNKLIVQFGTFYMGDLVTKSHTSNVIAFRYYRHAAVFLILSNSHIICHFARKTQTIKIEIEHGVVSRVAQNYVSQKSDPRRQSANGVENSALQM